MELEGGYRLTTNMTTFYFSLHVLARATDITTLISCLHALQSWFSLSGMALNPDKSDMILLGTRQHSRCYASLCSADVAGCPVSLCDCDHINILGINLDSHFPSINTLAPSVNLPTITSGHCVIFVQPLLMKWLSQCFFPCLLLSTVWVKKNPHLRFYEIFSQTVENF